MKTRKEIQKNYRENNQDKIKQDNYFQRQKQKQKILEERILIFEKETNGFDIGIFEDNYWVSSNGFIYKFKNFLKLKITTDNRTNYQTCSINNKTKMYHRVLGEMFIPNPENKSEINHKNGIRNDNRIENLEWVTRQENIKHSFDKLNKKSNLIGWSQNKTTSKYNYEQIKLLITQGETNKKIMEICGISSIGYLYQLKYRIMKL